MCGFWVFVVFVVVVCFFWFFSYFYLPKRANKVTNNTPGMKEDAGAAVALYKEAAGLGDPHGMVRLGRSVWQNLGGLTRDRGTAQGLIDKGSEMLRARIDSGKREHWTDWTDWTN